MYSWVLILIKIKLPLKNNLDKRNTVISGSLIFNFLPVLEGLVMTYMQTFVMDILELQPLK